MEFCWAFNLQFDFFYQWVNFVFQYFSVAITIALKYILKSGRVIPVVFLVLLEIVFSYSEIHVFPYDVDIFFQFQWRIGYTEFLIYYSVSNIFLMLKIYITHNEHVTLYEVATHRETVV